MTQLKNRKSLKQYRRDLRKRATLTERILWNYLRGKRQGHKFFRQYSIGSYIVDFYCTKAELAVELDGMHHYLDDKVIKYDKKRTTFLESKGVEVIRFKNKEVYDDVQRVLGQILSRVEKRMNSLGPS